MESLTHSDTVTQWYNQGILDEEYHRLRAILYDEDFTREQIQIMLGVLTNAMCATCKQHAGHLLSRDVKLEFARFLSNPERVKDWARMFAEATHLTKPEQQRTLQRKALNTVWSSLG